MPNVKQGNAMGLLDQFKAYIDANTPRNTRPAVSPQAYGKKAKKKIAK